MTAEPEPTRPLTPYERFVEATKRVLSVSKTSAPYRGFGRRSTIVGVPPSAGPNFAKSLIVVPRWTPENRPVVDGAKPASERAAPSASLLPRSIVIEQAPCVGVFGAEERGYRDILSTEIGAFLRQSAMRHPSVARSGRVPLAVEPGAPAPGPTREHVRVVEEPVEHRGDGRGVAEELAPVLHGPIRREQRRGALVAPHHDLEEILGRRGRKLPHPEIVDDEQRHGRDEGDVVLPRAGELGFGEILDEDVRLAIEHAVALLDRGEADRLRHVQADLQPGRDARAAELAQGALQFDDVHEVTSWIFRAMTSR